LRASTSTQEGGGLVLQNDLKGGGNSWVVYNMGAIYGNGLAFWVYPETTQRMFLSDSGNLSVAGSITAGGNLIANAALSVGGGGVTTSGNMVMNNGSPTLYFQDTDNRSAMIHCNSNILYFLRGCGANSTSWCSVNNYWPFTIDLENNNATFGGAIFNPNIRRSGGTASTVNINSIGEMFVPGSSIRYKENVKDLSIESSNKVLSLRPVTYTPKDEPVDINGVQTELYGLIAEEVFEVDPKLVIMGYSADCWEQVSIPNSEFKKRSLKCDAKPQIEGVHYDKIAVLLIDVVKRQQDEIKMLTERMIKLEKLS